VLPWDLPTAPAGAAFANGPCVGAVFMHNEMNAAGTADAAHPTAGNKAQVTLRSQIAHLESLSAALRQKQDIVKRIEKTTEEFSQRRARALGESCEWILSRAAQHQDGGARAALAAGTGWGAGSPEAHPASR
jgi:hypothetical protein